MEIRKKRVLVFAAFTLAILGLAGVWRLANSAGPELAPELAALATQKHRMPRNVTGGPPPPGTYWEVYSVPMPYPKLVEAMKRAPGWGATEGTDPAARVRTSFFPIEGGPMRQIDIRPGRLILGADLLSSDSRRLADTEHVEEYSVVTSLCPMTAPCDG